MGMYEALQGLPRPSVYHTSRSYALPGPREGERLCGGQQQSKKEGLTNKGSVRAPVEEALLPC